MILAGLSSLANEPVHEISNNVACATSKASDQHALGWSPICDCSNFSWVDPEGGGGAGGPDPPTEKNHKI